MQEFRENLKRHYLLGNRPVNREVLNLKAKEKAFLKVKKYNSAEWTRRKWTKEEEKDLQAFMEVNFKAIVSREEKKLKSKQQMALTALLKRI